MEALIRFDVAESRGRLMVVVESHLLPPDASVVVIPLLANYPAVRHLNPQIRHQDRLLILATRLIAGVSRAGLHRVGNVADQSDTITRAVDFLLAGT